MERPRREDNPFEDEKVAKEWVKTVEGERGMIRERELYPLLKKWSAVINPKIILDIGAGQGVGADHVQQPGGVYVGVEPSRHLVARAQEKHGAEGRTFVVGTAYEMPIKDAYADAVFSVNVWFHLENLDTATKEMARVLKKDGHFLISTANPGAYEDWEKMFENYTKEGKVMDGKANTPVQSLSRNRFYLHTMEELLAPLSLHGLVVDRVEGFGSPEKFGKDGLFVNIYGHKA